MQAGRFHIPEALALICAALALTAGCGGDDATRLRSYLDEFEFNAPLEEAGSISLGKFDVPVTAHLRGNGEDGGRTIWIRLTFELFAETTPENEASLQEAAEQHRGALNDALLTIIRTSSTDELTDPRLSALKLRMTEAARPLLGERRLRQLWLDDIDVHVM